MIRAIKGKPITVIENGTEILAEPKRQGNNLNQITRNSYNGLATEDEFIESRVLPILEKEEKARIKNFQKIYSRNMPK